jgi:hypothetical protein
VRDVAPPQAVSTRQPFPLTFPVQFNRYTFAFRKHLAGKLTSMKPMERSLGTRAAFLLPSLKLKGVTPEGPTFEQAIHEFLLTHFDGYTATASNLFGYWKDERGGDSYGEHRQFSVGLVDEKKLPELKRYLATLARQMDEDCIYLETGGSATLIYREQNS